MVTTHTPGEVEGDLLSTIDVSTCANLGFRVVRVVGHRPPVVTLIRVLVLDAYTGNSLNYVTRISGDICVGTPTCTIDVRHCGYCTPILPRSFPVVSPKVHVPKTLVVQIDTETLSPVTKTPPSTTDLLPKAKTSAE